MRWDEIVYMLIVGIVTAVYGPSSPPGAASSTASTKTAAAAYPSPNTPTRSYRSDTDCHLHLWN